MEDATIAAGRKIKAANPEANVGMYYRSDMALELADCSPSSAAWNAHPEWWLKDDKGNYVTKNGKAHQFDGFVICLQNFGIQLFHKFG